MTTKAELESKHLAELHTLAAEAGVRGYRMLPRAELIEKLARDGESKPPAEGGAAATGAIPPCGCAPSRRRPAPAPARARQRPGLRVGPPQAPPSLPPRRRGAAGPALARRRRPLAAGLERA